MELQSHEPTNAVFLNGHFLGYLPIKDWTYSWVSTSFSVPCQFLRVGYNELTIQAGHVAPQLQGMGFTWDDVLFRGVFLDRSTPDSLSTDAPDCGNAEGVDFTTIVAVYPHLSS